MTYTEESVQLALDSSVAVMALGNPNDSTDWELMPLKPHMMTEREKADLAARWHGRNLRPVGVVALVGATPKFALKVPLTPGETSALADAFLEHVHGVFCDGLFANQETDLRQMWERMN